MRLRCAIAFAAVIFGGLGRAAMAQNGQEGRLFNLAGLTYRVEDDLYFLLSGDRSVVVRIPEPYLRKYSTGRSGPNQVGIMGRFRFKGNTTGTNSLGGEITLELYEAVECEATEEEAREYIREHSIPEPVLRDLATIEARDGANLALKLRNSYVRAHPRSVFGGRADLVEDRARYIREVAEGRTTTTRITISPVLQRFDSHVQLKRGQRVLLITRFRPGNSSRLILVTLQEGVVKTGGWHLFRTSTDWVPHPDGIGYLHEWDGSAAVVVEGNPRILDGVLERYRRRADAEIKAMKTKMDLGELEEATYEQRCRAIEDEAYDQFLALVNSAAKGKAAGGKGSLKRSVPPP